MVDGITTAEIDAVADSGAVIDDVAGELSKLLPHDSCSLLLLVFKTRWPCALQR
jgi:hypothetical protein